MEKFVTYGGEVDSPSPINFPERVFFKNEREELIIQLIKDI